jgi:hypothetical protein
MGTIQINIDADVEGKRATVKFCFEGGDEEIDRLMKFAQGQADAEGVDPWDISASILYHLPEIGRTDDPGLMAFITDAVLRKQIERDVFVCDVAPHDNVVADISVRNKDITMKISGRPWAN